MRNTIFMILLIELTLLPLGCDHPYRDRELERRLTKTLIEFKNSDAPYLDLNPIFGSNWEKICLQGPYQDKKRFEKVIGQRVQGFNDVGEDLYVFWVLYPDGKAKWARVYRVSVMDRYPGIGISCTSFDHPKLYAKLYIPRGSYPSERKYFFIKN